MISCHACKFGTGRPCINTWLQNFTNTCMGCFPTSASKIVLELTLFGTNVLWIQPKITIANPHTAHGKQHTAHSTQYTIHNARYTAHSILQTANMT